MCYCSDCCTWRKHSFPSINSVYLRAWQHCPIVKKIKVCGTIGCCCYAFFCCCQRWFSLWQVWLNFGHIPVFIFDVEDFHAVSLWYFSLLIFLFRKRMWSQFRPFALFFAWLKHACLVAQKFVSVFVLKVFLSMLHMELFPFFPMWTCDERVKTVSF